MLSFSGIRPSPLAGRWYPAEADALREQIQDHLAPHHITETQSSKRYGVLAPHAGLRYSGPVAGAAFAGLRGQQYDVVVIIGPSHYAYDDLPLKRNTSLLTTGHAAYQTPLGDVPLHTKTLQNLAERVPLDTVRDDPEHAIEIELPFLQHVLSAEFALVPLAMLDQRLATAQRLAATLVDILTGQNVLFVASSDLSHFYDQATAEQLDAQVIDAVQAYDVAGVVAAQHDGRGLACGRGAVATVMLAARAFGAKQAHIAHYATSGDVSGDYTRVVGYLAASFMA